MPAHTNMGHCSVLTTGAPHRQRGKGAGLSSGSGLKGSREPALKLAQELETLPEVPPSSKSRETWQFVLPLPPQS